MTRKLSLRSGPQGFLVLLMVTLAGAVLPGTAVACGAHNPDLLARGLMNIAYPKSLYVTGAILKARAEGELPPVGEEPTRTARQATASLDRNTMLRMELEDTMGALYAVGVEIDEQWEEGEPSAIAVVVLRDMLWTRFSSDYRDVRQGLHVNGPRAGDIVLVTDEPVVSSIQAGEITIAHAINLGVIRVYGDEANSSALLARIGSIGEAPIPHEMGSMSLFGVSSNDWPPVDILRPTD